MEPIGRATLKLRQDYH